MLQILLSSKNRLCPEGHPQNKESQFPEASFHSRDDAEAFCQKEGGHLASANSRVIEAYISKEKDKRKLSSLHSQHLWIGGSDKEKEGVWKWSDGSPWNYTRWNKHQPSSDGVSPDEDCLQYYQFAEKWSDRPCSDEGNFVCSQMMCPG